MRQYYESVPADSYKDEADRSRLAFEILLLLRTIYAIFIECLDILSYIRSPKARLVEYLNLGNVIDWASFACILYSAYYWLRIHSLGLAGVDLLGENAAAGTRDTT